MQNEDFFSVLELRIEEVLSSDGAKMERRLKVSGWMDASQCEYITKFFQWYDSEKTPTNADRHPSQSVFEWEDLVKQWTRNLRHIFDFVIGTKERVMSEPNFVEEERHTLRPLQLLFGILVEPPRKQSYNLAGEARHLVRLACIFTAVRSLGKKTCTFTNGVSMTHKIFL